ncbi:MAG: RlpA-like double-psi beta-barrel domain-containing protein [Patescibacteria group bacterium]
MNIFYKNLILLGAFFLFLVPNISHGAELELSSPGFTGVATIATSSPVNVPWEWRNLSSVYNYSFTDKNKYDPSRPITIKIYYSAANNYFKQIFMLDELSGVWQPILTQDVPDKKYVTATTNSLEGKLIILSNPEILAIGTASWYKYKNGNFAASPDFAKGSILRVTNLANGKSVDVTINDFGPERAKHPDRVIDLDKVAFGRIASVGAGLIKIKVEPLKVIKPLINKSQLQLSSVPTISASSAIILRESDGSIIWGKNENKVSPLASLTKLVAVRTFLDLKPSLNQVVSYKVQDEKYNYLYCKPGESAKLTVKDGDTLTIENLLYGALVGSANNAVESLVRISGLSREEFIKRMNKNVKDWGANNTSFIEPTGLSPKNVSSPYDYAIISKEVYNSPIIKKISTAASYSFKTINTKIPHTLRNTSQLVRNAKYPIIGSKTGYINESGNCLMTRVASPQGNLIVINFGSPTNAASLFDNEQLIRYGLLQLKK